jgi:hypothetical protein
MAALTPAVPDVFDVTSVGKVRIWLAPTFGTGDTVTVPGLKQVFSVTNAKTGVVSWTSSLAANALGVVLTLTVSASSTGNTNPLVVYGR